MRRPQREGDGAELAETGHRPKVHIGRCLPELLTHGRALHQHHQHHSADGDDGDDADPDEVAELAYQCERQDDEGGQHRQKELVGGVGGGAAVLLRERGGELADGDEVGEEGAEAGDGDGEVCRELHRRPEHLGGRTGQRGRGGVIGAHKRTTTQVGSTTSRLMF